MTDARTTETRPTARCPSCDKTVDREAAECGSCGRLLTGLCECGVVLSALDGPCATCGISLTGLRSSKPRKMRRVVRGGLVLLVAAAVGAWFVATRPKKVDEIPPWRLKDRALQHYESEDLEAARADFLALTRRAPADAQGWYMLALVDQRLELDRDSYIAAAREAVRLDGGMMEARVLLALEFARGGDLAESEKHVGVLLRSGTEHPAILRLAGELELAKPQPNVARALEWLQAARTQGDGDAKLRLRISSTRLKLLGAGDGSRYDPATRSALRETEEALAELDQATRESAAGRLHALQVHVGLGRNDEAIALATLLLKTPDVQDDASLRAKVRLALGRAHHQTGDLSKGIEAFAAALGDSPVVGVASSVTEFLDGAGHADAADELLLTATDSVPDDPTLAAYVAARRLVRGDLEGAGVWVERGLAADPDDPTVLVVAGDLRRLAGDPQKARELYEKARAAEGAGATPGIRIALLVLDLQDLVVREKAVRASIEELESLPEGTGESAEALRALGTLHTAAGNHEAAREALTKLTRTVPSSADGWAALGDAWSRAPGLTAVSEAARSYDRAVAIRPRDLPTVEKAARAYLQLGLPMSAVTACSRMLDRVPGATEIRLIRADALRRAGQWSKAASDLRTVVDGGRDSDAVLLAWVDVEYRAGRDLQAGLVLDRVRARSDGVLPVEFELVRRIHEQGAAEAVAAVRAAGPSALLAQLQLLLRQTDEAAATLRSALRADPTDWRAARLFVLAALDSPDPAAAVRAEIRSVIRGVSESAPAGVTELMHGRLLLALGKNEDALATLRRAAEALPEDPFAQFFFGEALRLTGAGRTSLGPIRRGAFLPGAPRVLRPMAAERIAHVCGAMEDKTHVESLLREALRLDPACVPAVRQLCGNLYAAGRYEACAKAAEGFLQRPGLAVPVRKELRRVAMTARIANLDTDEAIRHLDHLDESDLEGASLLVLRGMLLVRGNRLDDAVSVFREAVEADPDNRAALIGLLSGMVRAGKPDDAVRFVREWSGEHDASSDVALSLSEILERAGDLERALSVVRDAAARRPGDRRLVTTQSYLLATMGLVEDAAVAVRNAVRAASPEERPVLELLLASVNLQLGDEALAALETARRHIGDPAADASLLFRARTLEAEALLRLGRTDEAGKAARQLLDGWPPADAVTDLHQELAPRLRFVRGSAAFSGGDRDLAVTDLEAVLDVAPNHVAALNNLAWILSDAPATADRALTLSRRAAKLQTTDPNTWDTLGRAALAAGRPGEAITAWQTAGRLYAETADPAQNPARGRTSLRLAAALRDLDRETEAADVARAVIEYAGDSAVAERAREFLRGR